MYVPENYDFYRQREKEQGEWLEKRPICSECKEHIQDEDCYVFNDEIICSDCLKDNHRKQVDDIVGTYEDF